MDIAPFVRVAGPTFSVQEDSVDIFLTLFTTDLLDHIIAEMKRFATACFSMSQESAREGEVSSWQTNSEDIKAFIGFCILMVW